MIPWEHLDTTPIPGSDSKLRLSRRGDEFSIAFVGGGVLMTSRAHASEDALAEQTCQRLGDKQAPQLLIGGLGMGFTLAAALGRLGSDARVTVAELVPAVIDWNRGPLGAAAGNPLDDPRTSVHCGDVAELIRSKKGTYDAILLDVDNGPEAMTRKQNNWLYTAQGLRAACSALKPSGILAVWSAGPDRHFETQLRKIGFKVEQETIRAHNKKGDRHTIWLARR